MRRKGAVLHQRAHCALRICEGCAALATDEDVRTSFRFPFIGLRFPSRNRLTGRRFQPLLQQISRGKISPHASTAQAGIERVPMVSPKQGNSPWERAEDVQQYFLIARSLPLPAALRSEVEFCRYGRRGQGKATGC